MARERRRSTARRLVIGAGLLAIVAVPLLIGGVLWLNAATSTVGTMDFARELRIPPLLEPKQHASGRKLFTLDMRAGTSELTDGKRTPQWGFNGAHLGPTLRASRGDELALRATNRLGQATSIHWHGMHLPARADGGPHQPIEPGETWAPSWRIDQPAATLWYHPHPHGRTQDHVYRGLAGIMLQHEDRGMMGQFAAVRPGDRRPEELEHGGQPHPRRRASRTDDRAQNVDSDRTITTTTGAVERPAGIVAQAGAGAR